MISTELFIELNSVQNECFYQVMTFDEPDNWRLITEQKYANMRPSSLGVPSMVCITKSVCQHEINSRKWLSPWY